MLRPFFHFLACAALVSVFLVLRAEAASPELKTPGRISVAKVTGDAFVYTTDYALRLPIETGAFLQQGQTVVTEKGASLLMVMPNGATLQLGEAGQLRVDEFLQSPFADPQKLSALKAEPSSSITRLNLMRGEIISDVKKLNKADGSQFLIKTPVGAAGIRGTAFRLAFTPNGNKADFALVMAEGSIEFIFNTDGSGVIVDRGRQLVIRNISFDAGSGKILGLPAGWKVEEASVDQLSQLLQNLQHMLASVEDVTIHPTRAGSSGEEPEQANPDKNLPSLPLTNVLPSAQDPNSRTSPLQGRESL